MRNRTHPAEVLREEFLLPLCISESELARRLKVTQPTVAQIVAEKRAVSADKAIRLGKHFGTTPDFWINMQTAHDLSKAAKESAREIKKIQPAAELAAL